MARRRGTVGGGPVGFATATGIAAPHGWLLPRWVFLAAAAGRGKGDSTTAETCTQRLRFKRVFLPFDLWYVPPLPAVSS
jgi:hypothetical protein